MPHRQANVKACLEILDHKLKEYIQTHDYWHGKGYLCPHEGNPKAHEVMDEIIEDVQQAHDMLEIAMHRAGFDDEAIHHGRTKLENPASAAQGMRKLPGQSA